MQCTLPRPTTPPPSHPPVAATTTSRSRPVTAAALAAAFATVPDPRRRQGTRFALPAILTLVVAAVLANHLSVLAIAEWGAGQRADLLRALGFPKGVAPCQSTLQRLLQRLDADRLSAALTAYFAPGAAADPAERGGQGVGIDGKAQRGRLRFDPDGCPVHALTAFCHDHGVVLAHEPIDEGEEKQEAELTVAPALLARVDWRGRVLTGDALFCQRHLCRQVLEAEGDYLLLVKANQPTLYHDIRLLCDPPAGTDPLPLLDRRAAWTIETGHGRQDDTRYLIASTDLTEYLDWPGAAQVFRLERTWRAHDAPKQEVHYGITSLPPAVGTPARLLALKRGHWAIENSLHRVKDVTLGEDASLIRDGRGPTIMALLRDAAVSLLHRAGWRAVASRLRYHSTHPAAILPVLGVTPHQNA